MLSIWTQADEDGPLDEIEIINFLQPRRTTRVPIQTKLRDATPIGEQSLLRAVTLPHLVVLKLYAGSLRDPADVVELLAHNPNADIEAIRALCATSGVDGFEALVVEACKQR